MEMHTEEVAYEKIRAFVALLLEENASQNLISRASIAEVWSRHVVDSAQLVSLAPSRGMWIDIGSGGGLPGVVGAILHPSATTLIEPRRRRADFLQRCVDVLDLQHTVVECRKAEALNAEPAAIVTARAVGSVDALFTISAGFSNLQTTFIMPRGQTAADELAIAQKTWHGMFHVKRSITSDKAGIIVATNVRRR